PAEVPARAANRHAVEVAIPRWDLEAATVDADRAIGLALCAPVLGAKCLSQYLARGAWPSDVLAVEEAPQWRRANLRVALAVVLVLDPCLGDLVQPGEREVLDVLEHRDEPTLELGPEALLLRVLIRRVRQRHLVHDAEPRQPLLHFGGLHRRALVGHQRPRLSALVDRLLEPVHEVLRVLGEVPLQVT